MKKAISAPPYHRLIKWLSTSRQEQQLSMRDLADRLGVPHSVVQKVEAYERRLDVYEYCLFCKALSLDPAQGLAVMRFKG